MPPHMRVETTRLKSSLRLQGDARLPQSRRDDPSYTFYALAGVILTHVAAMIVTEIREGGSITSAMFTGQKILKRSPQDVGR
jgi:hypothetical protein